MITLKNQSGVKIQVPTGFSWTTLLFGCFVPLFRGDMKWFVVMLILALLTYGISNLIFPFFYNSVYLQNLLTQGFIGADKDSENWLKLNNMIV